MTKPYFMGNQFVWWQGVVEDVNDPLMLGRCRVRILGFHHPDTEMIPTADLPWAMVIQPVTSAAISQVGYSPTGLLPGSWVVGFFRDPEYLQEPIIMGSIAGVPIQQGVDIGSGFRDPSGKYPLKSLLYESDLSRLARNEYIDNTIVARKIKTSVKKVTSAFGLTAWSEPKTPYNARYPKNHVYQSESGHVQEFDDTPKKERIHTYHRSGTFQEVHPDGTTVNKIVSNNYEIILKNDRVLIRGRKYENIDKDSMLKIGGNFNIEVEGDATFVVNGNTVMQTNGDHFHKIKGTYTIASEGNMTLVAPRIDLNPDGVDAGDVDDVLKDFPAIKPLEIDKIPPYGSAASDLLSLAASLNPQDPFGISSILSTANIFNPANLLKAVKSLNLPSSLSLDAILSPAISLDVNGVLNVAASNLNNALGSINPSDLNSTFNTMASNLNNALKSLDPNSVVDSSISSGMHNLLDKVNSLDIGGSLNASSMINPPDLLNAAKSLNLQNSLNVTNTLNPLNKDLFSSVESLSKEGMATIIKDPFPLKSIGNIGGLF